MGMHIAYFLNYVTYFWVATDTRYTKCQVMGSPLKNAQFQRVIHFLNPFLKKWGTYLFIYHNIYRIYVFFSKQDVRSQLNMQSDNKISVFENSITLNRKVKAKIIQKPWFEICEWICAPRLKDCSKKMAVRRLRRYS